MAENEAPEQPHEGGDRSGGRLGALAALRRGLPGHASGAGLQPPASSLQPPGSSATTVDGEADRDPTASRFPRFASDFWSGLRLPDSGFRISPLIAGLCAATLAVALVGGLAYYAARTFTGRAADSRASEEAASFAAHSSTLATGDAFMGYLQILRYAEDNVLRARIATGDQREAVLQQQIYLNTNRMYALAVADRSGRVLASVGMELRDLRGSEAFNRSISAEGPANSDIVLPEDGASGYVEYTSMLLDPIDGTPWGVLYGRANPAVLWRGTLNATIDGSRNVIINQKGQFAAGVPSDLLGQPWRGQPLANGGVRADIAGVDSICGLGTVGEATQIDRGWAVASCLPASLVNVEANDALGQLGLIVVAACVLAIVLAGSLLRIFLGDPGAARAPARQVELEAADGDEAPPGVPVIPAEATLPVFNEADRVPPAETREAEEPVTFTADPIDEVEPSAVIPSLTPVIHADVDALDLIAAYESRNARLADQLRERLAAPLMIAASQAQDAFERAAATRRPQVLPEAAAESDHLDDTAAPPDLEALRRQHEGAIADLERLRERDLRGISQELHPGLVALGLPSALRSLLADAGLSLTLDIDPEADSHDGGAGRAVVDDARRTVVYRAARELLAHVRESGATECEITLTRESGMLVLSAKADAAIDAGALAASRIAAEAYGGSLAIDAASTSECRIELRLPAPDPAHGAPTGEFPVPEPDTALVRVIELPPDVHGESSLRASLEATAADTAAMRISIDVDEALDDDAVPEGLRDALGALTATALAALEHAGAASSTVWVRRIRDEVFATITSHDTGAAAIDSPAFEAARERLEALGGTVAVTADGGSLAVSAEAPLPSPAAEAA